jgi:hypothetical protein
MRSCDAGLYGYCPMGIGGKDVRQLCTSISVKFALSYTYNLSCCHCTGPSSAASSARGITIIVDPPPGNHISSTVLGGFFVAAAIVIAVRVPLKAYMAYENRTNMLIGMCIDQLKNGDWTRDNKARVLKMIEQDKAAITKFSDGLNRFFLVLLGFLIASNIDWSIFHHDTHTTATGLEAGSCRAGATATARTSSPRRWPLPVLA